MRALLANSEVTASPGQPFSLGLEVSNTEEVIDSVSVSVSGLPGATVKTVPGELALFPGTSGTTVLTVELPPGFPAGRHEATVEARARVSADEAASCQFVLDVEPVSRATLSVSPLTRTAKRKSRFSLFVENLGNTSLDVSVNASDPERALRLQCIPEKVSIAPGSSAEILLAVQGPRHTFGSERTRQVTVEGTAVPVAYARTSTDEPAVLEESTPVPLEVRCTYVQKPRIPRRRHRCGAGGHRRALGRDFYPCLEHGPRPTIGYQVCPAFVFRPGVVAQSFFRFFSGATGRRQQCVSGRVPAEGRGPARCGRRYRRHRHLALRARRSGADNGPGVPAGGQNRRGHLGRDGA